MLGHQRAFGGSVSVKELIEILSINKNMCCRSKRELKAKDDLRKKPA